MAAILYMGILAIGIITIGVPVVLFYLMLETSSDRASRPSRRGPDSQGRRSMRPDALLGPASVRPPQLFRV